MIHYVLHVMPYIGYSALITAVCFLFYRLLLRRETFFYLNRWFFLGCMVFSFLLPLVPVPGEWSVRSTLLSEISGAVAGINLTQTPEVRVSYATKEPVLSTTLATTPVTGTPPTATAGTRFSAAAITPPAGKPTAKPLDASASSATSLDALASPAAPLNASASAAAASLRRAISYDASRHPVPADFADQDPAVSPETLAGANVPPRPAVPQPTGFRLAGFFQCLFYLYLCGVVVFGINLVLQFVTLFMRVRHRPIIRDGWFRIVETGGNGAPCSFGRYIFINPALYDDETYEQILAHEKIHVQQGHSIDIMLAELCIVLQWFNPFAWRYRKALEDNLEFLTDAAVIKNPHTDASHYQMSLLRVSAPHLPLSITSNYNQSLLKKRIIMMHIKKSSVRTTWKYFFLPPLLMAMVCLFNATSAQRQSSQTHTLVKDTLPQDAPQTTPNVPAPPAPPAPPVVSAPGAPGYVTDTLMDNNERAVNVSAPIALNLNLDSKLNMSIDSRVEDVKVMDVRVDPNPMPNMDFNMDFKFDIRDTGDDDFRAGTWMGTINGDDVQLTLRTNNGDETSSSHFKKSEFSSLPTGQKADFTLTRDAGTLSLNGVFDGNDGFGHYTFKVNEDFAAFLKKEGVTWTRDNRLVGAFFANLTREYVETMAQAGYSKLPLHDLIALSSMKIDPAYIKSWKDKGYPDLPVHDVIALKAMKVDADFVKQLEDAGFAHPAVHELIAAKSMNIDAAYMQSWKQYGFTNPSIHDLVGLKSMGIDGAYLKMWKDMGYTNLQPHELMGLKSQNVDGNYIQELKDAGFDHLQPHELMGLKSMGITGAYIKQVRAMGNKDLQPHDVLAFKSMNIDGKYVQGFEAIGYSNLDPHQLVAFKSIGITPEFIKGFADIGFKDIPPHLLMSLKSTGVTSDYVIAMKNKGFDSKDLQEYVKLKTFR